MDLRAAERCLHDRCKTAFAAAAQAALPGRFWAFEHNGLLASLTTSPGLSLLNSVSGLTEDTVDVLPGVIALFEAAGAPSPSLAVSEPTAALAAELRRLGYVPAQPRPVGILDLAIRTNSARTRSFRLTAAGTEVEKHLFLETLAAGYGAGSELSRFLRAEHSAAGMRCFVAWHGDRPVAAAAFSAHDNGIVLGGAATVPAARRSGAQTALLNHRLNQAVAGGAKAVVVTAAPDSASLRNLVRAGFTMRCRPGWKKHEGGGRRPLTLA
jgi:GNAT superfamily N-acetyltransferase